jgi:anti-sigma regulatory factor (Ser/Thr protein kinase)
MDDRPGPREARFPALLVEARAAVAWARARAEEAGLAEGRVLEVELAAEELFVNVCVHARGGRSGAVTLRSARTGEGFLLGVEDDGPPFDPLSFPLPDDAAPLEEREPGGLGLLIVRRVATDLRWRREGDRNVVTLVFAGPEDGGERRGV